jgi:NitT/TauT family transport system ATP-binding protein
MATIASLDAAEVAYPGRGLVLGPFSLAFDAGEIVALVGPSGCGKSTALRLLAGLETPSGGRVHRAAGRGETAVVFQARSRARAALTSVRLTGVEAAKPAQLSGGMAMRVSLARALVTEPRLLMLDEPFAALDEITRRALADDIHTLWCASRPGMVFVTHNVEEAVYMASRVVVMTPGPGTIVLDRPIDAPLPRPDGFRTTALFRETVEAVSAALAQAMAA